MIEFECVVLYSFLCCMEANMQQKKYFDLGVVVGRFGHEHLGHVSLFEASLMLCKRTLVLVGSAQESGTLRNPFRVETRIEVIRETYPGYSDEELTVRGLNNLTNENDITPDWGKYVRSQVEYHKHKFANLMIYGNDDNRSKWFAPEDLVGVNEFIIARETLPISATMVRGLLTIGDEKEWQKVTPQLIHCMYPRLRDDLLSVPIYGEIYNRIRRTDMTLDDFMSVYKELEEQDKQKKLAAIVKMNEN